jgi:hypothetical protein
MINPDHTLYCHSRRQLPALFLRALAARVPTSREFYARRKALQQSASVLRFLCALLLLNSAFVCRTLHLAPAPHCDLQHPSPPRSRTAAAPSHLARGLRRLRRHPEAQSLYNDGGGVHSRILRAPPESWGWTWRRRMRGWRRCAHIFVSMVEVEMDVDAD